MKRNQKKYTKRNRKGGLPDQNTVKISMAALKKRLDSIESQLGTVKTKIGEVEPVEGKSRENDVGLEEAGFPEEKPVVGQNNPMNPKFTSNPATNEKYNGSEPITDTQFNEVDRLTDEIKILQSNPNKFDREKLKTLNGLRNALFNKYKIRYEYLKKEKDARKLSDAETDQYYILESNLNNRSFGGRGKSRRYKKSKRSTRRRTRKYKK